MPLKAVSTSDVDKKDLQTRWYLNMPNKEFRDPLPSMDPKEKEGKRQEIFDKFKSTTITVQSPATKKTVGVDVLVPKIVLENKIPGGRLSPKIHVRFHGGGFCTGAPLYPNWFPFYVRDLCLDNYAITLLPRYRLMPEVHGEEILEDTDIFWDWYQGEEFTLQITKTLQGLDSKYVPKYYIKTALLVSGESAGGFLAAYSYLSRPGLPIRCMFLQYPMLKAYSREAGLKYRNVEISEKEVQDFAKSRFVELETLEKEDKLKELARTASDPPEGMDMAYVMSSAKRPEDRTTSYWKYWFAQKDIIERAEELWNGPLRSCAIMPQTYIIHGEADSNCSWTDSQDFERIINTTYPQDNPLVVLILRKKEQHAFDYSFEGNDDAQKDWLPQLKKLIENAWDAAPKHSEGLELLDTEEQEIWTLKNHLAGHEGSAYAF